MKFDHHIPIYLQIIDLIKKDIVTGMRNPGDKLDSVREYAARLKVNPNTIQKAYQEMEREGLAYSQRGIGRFIINDFSIKDSLMKEMSGKIVEEYINHMRAIGYTDEAIIERLKETLEGDNNESN